MSLRTGRLLLEGAEASLSEETAAPWSKSNATSTDWQNVKPSLVPNVVLKPLPAAGNRDEANTLRSLQSPQTCFWSRPAIVLAKQGFMGTPTELQDCRDSSKDQSTALWVQCRMGRGHQLMGDIWTPVQSSRSTATHFISFDSHNLLITEQLRSGPLLAHCSPGFHSFRMAARGTF